VLNILLAQTKFCGLRKKMKRTITVILLSTLFTGCATYNPVPPEYTGPVALVSDRAVSESYAKAQIFALMEIDGNRVSNSFNASASASYGQGPVLRTKIVERNVPAKPMKVVIRGSHATGAPIHALFSQAAGTFFSIDGAVDFSPKPNGRYVVNGELKKEGSSVWIEDAETKEIVTEKVTPK
jgi:hypothetical protein